MKSFFARFGILMLLVLTAPAGWIMKAAAQRRERAQAQDVRLRIQPSGAGAEPVRRARFL